MSNNTYKINELARMANVTVRTLHHYDRIGLLSPGGYTEGGFRLYGRPELLRLQQILFYRELDVPLKQIRSLLDDPDVDPIEILKNQHRLLTARGERLMDLLNTLERTIEHLEDNTMPLKDEDLYKGMSKEEIEAIKTEVDEKTRKGEYDPRLVEQSRQRVGKMSKQQFADIGTEADDINRELAALMDRAVSDPEVQALIERHHAWIENFYDCDATVYRGLAEMYLADERFKANYEKVAPGLAAYLSEAMIWFAEKRLTNG